MERIEWKFIDEDRIEVLINGRRGLKDGRGKFIDAFTQKTFEINPKELLTFQRVFSNIAFDYCKKFKGNTDEIFFSIFPEKTNETCIYGIKRNGVVK
jgi:hypothetical protein